METIDIINNIDQKIIIENVLIMNQKKLLDMIIQLFTTEFNNIQDLTQDIVSVKLNSL